jgi:glycosyltransferase involved in cell wall biosynthesis
MIKLFKKYINTMGQSDSGAVYLNAALIIRANNGISLAQKYPFEKFKKELIDKLDFKFKTILIDSSQDLTNQSTDLSRFNIIFIQGRVIKLIPYDERINIFRALKEKSRIVVLDDHDGQDIAHFYLLPYIDLYVKKQLLSDLDNYKNKYICNQVTIDYLTKIYGLSGSSEDSYALDDHEKEKLFLGWNLGTEKSFEDMLKKQKNKAYRNLDRPIDINCRITTKGNKNQSPRPGWYVNHRSHIKRILKELEGQFNVIATDRFLPWKKYIKELRKSKICVSPFGFGDICWRDFESVICGCLLIKPSMEHLTTKPNIYIDKQTYVAVKWDLSDLKEKCEYYLKNEDERNRIISNAAEELSMSYSDSTFFVSKVQEMLTKIDLAKNNSPVLTGSLNTEAEINCKP